MYSTLLPERAKRVVVLVTRHPAATPASSDETCNSSWSAAPRICIELSRRGSEW